MTPIKTLIVKTSSIQLVNGERKRALGEVLRTGVLLDSLPGSYLWLTDVAAVPLLSAFVPKECLRTAGEGLAGLEFSRDLVVYYLDDHDDCFPLLQGLSAEWRGNYAGRKDRLLRNDALAIALNPYRRVPGSMSWQETLIRGVGMPWTGQDYPVRDINQACSVDFGLNSLSDPGWSSKRLPADRWTAVADILSTYGTVSWQRGSEDMAEYIRWLASCRVVITHDSLGVHLASALRKHVVILGGPTDSGEEDYGRLVRVSPLPRTCMPCHAPSCHTPPHCMDGIEATAVVEAARRALQSTSDP